jgi:hypothetical protein
MSCGKQRLQLTKFTKMGEPSENVFESESESEDESDNDSPIDPGPDYPDPGILFYLLVVELAKKLVVFHVGDSGDLWPGISIPQDEFDKSIFPDLTKEDEVIRYFEDGSLYFLGFIDL